MRSTIQPHTKGIYDFGEISSLQEVLKDTKKYRQGRQPQHIMIVEDEG